jgi:hypothetical protein
MQERTVKGQLARLHCKLLFQKSEIYEQCSYHKLSNDNPKLTKHHHFHEGMALSFKQL